MPEFRGWAEPETYIAKGYIDVEDDVYFSVAFDAANCFGRDKGILQKAFVWHPRESEKTIWFPKFTDNRAVQDVEGRFCSRLLSHLSRRLRRAYYHCDAAPPAH